MFVDSDLGSSARKGVGVQVSPSALPGRGFIGFVLIFLILWVKLRMEEQWMCSQFGETYANYAQHTAALVPYLLRSPPDWDWRFTFSKQKATFHRKKFFRTKSISLSAIRLIDRGERKWNANLGISRE